MENGGRGERGVDALLCSATPSSSSFAFAELKAKKTNEKVCMEMHSKAMCEA